jgi:hypothetical protein
MPRVLETPVVREGVPFGRQATDPISAIQYTSHVFSSGSGYCRRYHCNAVSTGFNLRSIRVAR